MHELSVFHGLYHKVEEIARKHRADKVIRIVVDLGVMSDIQPELLKESFATFREAEVLLKDAKLEIRQVPVRLRCESCHKTWDFMAEARCPQCSSTDIEVLQGQDLILRDVELEVPDA
jgi:hydrogenase nickel incorporation protein HypA/HybF